MSPSTYYATACKNPNADNQRYYNSVSSSIYNIMSVQPNRLLVTYVYMSVFPTHEGCFVFSTRIFIIIIYVLRIRVFNIII